MELVILVFEETTYLFIYLFKHTIQYFKQTKINWAYILIITKL